MRVLVTRPIREAQSWLQALKSAGLDPVALPLIEIAPLDDLRPVTEVWRQIIRYRAVMFVSANAVDFFLRPNPSQLPPNSRLSRPATCPYEPGRLAPAQQAHWREGVCLQA